MTKVILFGGSFNPPHMAHIFATCYLSQHDFDQILVAPVCIHPYGKKLESFHHRYEMCLRAMGWIPKVNISDIEEYISRGTKPNYTADTIARLKEAHPDWELHFLVGADTAKDIREGKWAHSEKLLNAASPFVLGRVGVNDENQPILPKISSTEIRESLKGSRILAKLFLPNQVLDYIESHDLYK